MTTFSKKKRKEKQKWLKKKKKKKKRLQLDVREQKVKKVQVSDWFLWILQTGKKRKETEKKMTTAKWYKAVWGA